MAIDDVTESVIGAAIKVHRALGPGLLESAYEACMTHELVKGGFMVRRQVEVPVIYDGVRIECGFRADLVVEGVVVVELKAKERIAPVDLAQLLSYLRLMKVSVGLLINFHEKMLRDGIRRVVNEYQN